MMYVFVFSGLNAVIEGNARTQGREDFYIEFDSNKGYHTITIYWM